MAVGPGAPSIHPDRELTPVVLVTGGSRGIGLALARTFAGRGYDLMLVARGLERLQRVAEKIAAEFGVSVEAIACDLARAQGATELVEAVGAKGRYIDILVNCAGVGTAGPFERNTPAQVHTALHLNIDAATALMRACLPDMVARRRGGVLNVASLAGALPMPYLAVYGATKSYLASLSQAVAQEVAGTGVTVSVLLPGPVDTGFFAHDGQPHDEQELVLVPGLTATEVARTAVDGFLARQRVITPGMLAWLCRLGVKLLPRRLPVDLVGLMLGRPHAPDAIAPQREGSARGHPAPGRKGWTIPVPGHVLLLACIAIVFVLQVGIGTRKLPQVDAGPRSNIAAVASLLKHGTFADAFSVDGTNEPQPGRYLAPGYPAFLAGFALLDRNLATAIQCLAAGGRDCTQGGNPFRPLIALQTLLTLLAFALLFHVARDLSRSAEIAALAVGLTFVMGRFNDFVTSVNAYAIVPSLALIFAATLFVAHRRRSVLLATIAGLTLGFVALTEVYYAALVVVAPLLLIWAGHTRTDTQERHAWIAAAALAFAACFVIGPWVARNYWLFADLALTDGTATKNLAERVAYSGLSWHEWRAASLFWLPGIGDLSSLLSPTGASRKFDVYYTGSLLLESGRILESTPPARRLRLRQPLRLRGHERAPARARSAVHRRYSRAVGMDRAAAPAAPPPCGGWARSIPDRRRSATGNRSGSEPAHRQPSVDERAAGVRLRIRHCQRDRRTRVAVRTAPPL
jgi:short-subunit dehydrogenase